MKLLQSEKRQLPEPPQPPPPQIILIIETLEAVLLNTGWRCLPRSILFHIKGINIGKENTITGCRQFATY